MHALRQLANEAQQLYQLKHRALPDSVSLGQRLRERSDEFVYSRIPSHLLLLLTYHSY